MEVLDQEPQIGSFVPLAEHQSATPASFYSGPPVLHYYSDRCKIIVLAGEFQHAPALSNLVSKAASTNQAGATEDTNGTHAAQKTIEEVDVWVTSDKLLLYCKPYSTGLSIPYPTISLHATQSLPAPSSNEPGSQSLYMQLVPSLPESTSQEDDEPPDTVSLTIVPTASAPPPPTAPTGNGDEALATEDEPQLTPVQALYQALSACSDLHPDPDDDDEEDGEGASRLMQAGLAIPGTSDGSMPPTMPGSGGWITAENMHEFVDEDGNFVADPNEVEGMEAEDVEEAAEELGPGAGTVRARAEDEKHGDDSEESKWQRTS